MCFDILRALPNSAMGNRYLVSMGDRFIKLTRVVSLLREDAKAVASEFCDTLVASFGPPDTLLTGNGPRVTSTLYQGV